MEPTKDTSTLRAASDAATPAQLSFITNVFVDIGGRVIHRFSRLGSPKENHWKIISDLLNGEGDQGQKVTILSADPSWLGVSESMFVLFLILPMPKQPYTLTTPRPAQTAPASDSQIARSSGFSDSRSVYLHQIVYIGARTPASHWAIFLFYAITYTYLHTYHICHLRSRLSYITSIRGVFASTPRKGVI